VVYLKAGNTEEMQAGIHTLLHQESERPVLLEVSTNPSDDERALRDYYKTFKI
jgi:2-succinyl-5-enolpyruvyl-6-hydroxy-3-cyclohexene-1-carboxylate synthase